MLSYRSSISCMLRSVRSLWVAYVVLVGLIVGLVGGLEIQVWSQFDPVLNPCHEQARFPAMCVSGSKCVNTGPRAYDSECVWGYPWSESVHPNVKVWFDASDINGNGVPDVEEGYVPAGGLVDEWVSRVGGITATAVGSSPSLNASAVGGKHSVHFTGQYLGTIAAVTLSHDFSLFLVIDSEESTTGGIRIVLEQGDNAVAQSGFYCTTRSFTARVARTTSTGANFASWNSLTTVPKTGALFSDGSSFLWRTNGGHEGLFAKPSGAVSVTKSIFIGCRNGAWYCFSGYIAEIIIIDGILPLSDVQAIESYLMSKYSIT